MQVRAAAAEAAQRTHGAWLVPTPAAAPRPDPRPVHSSSSPAPLQRVDTAAQLAGSGPLPSAAPRVIQSPHAIAAVLQDSRSPHGSPPTSGSPPGPGRAQLGSPRQRAASRSPFSGAAGPGPTREPGVDLGTEASTWEGVAKLPASPEVPAVLFASGQPVGPGRKAARRNSHRTLRTLQVTFLTSSRLALY